MRRSFLAIVIALFATGPAFAGQARGSVSAPAAAGHGAVAPRAAAASAPSARAGAARPTSHSAVAGRPRPGVPTSRSRRYGPSYAPQDQYSSDYVPVPGLGFDYTHLAGTRPGSLNARRNRGFVSFFPFFDGGYYASSAADAAPTETASDDYQQQPVADSESPAEPPRRVRPMESTRVVSSDQIPQAPTRDVEEYVFVRRDGTLFFAVAYTWDNSTLRYITSEGWRRTADGSTLDLDATLQFNEQRGLRFRIPVLGR